MQMDVATLVPCGSKAQAVVVLGQYMYLVKAFGCVPGEVAAAYNSKTIPGVSRVVLSVTMRHVLVSCATAVSTRINRKPSPCRAPPNSLSLPL